MVVVSRDGKKEVGEYIEELELKIKDQQEQKLLLKPANAAPVVVEKKEKLKSIETERNKFLLSMESENKKIASVKRQLEIISKEIKI